MAAGTGAGTPSTTKQGSPRALASRARNFDLHAGGGEGLLNVALELRTLLLRLALNRHDGAFVSGLPLYEVLTVHRFKQRRLANSRRSSGC